MLPLPLVFALAAWQPLTHRNYSAFAKLRGVKILHLYRVNPSDLFHRVYQPLLTELGICSAAINCSAQNSDKLRQHIGGSAGARAGR